VEDYELQEIEFWRKVEEESMSRSAMLRRSAAAAVGLTILSSPAAAWAARAGEEGAMTAAGISLKELIKRAKKEGQLNVIALPHSWANYGAIISTFKNKYGLKMDEANPDGTSAQENQAIRSLKGTSRAPDVVDVGPSFAIAGATEGLYVPYKVKTYKTIPKNMKDSRARWYGDYWGAISIGYNASLVKPAPKTFKDLLGSAYRNKVALNGNPLTSNSAVSGVFAAALANGRHRLLQAAQEGRQLHPGRRHATDRRLRPDADRNRLGLPQPRLSQAVPRGQLADRGPVRRRLRIVLLPGDQCDGAAPECRSSMDGVPLLRPGAAALAQGVFASLAVPGSGEAKEDPGRAAESAALCEAVREG